MKLMFSILSIGTTGGITSLSTVNYSNTSHKLDVNQHSEQNLSTKNIPELSKINDLKIANKIPAIIEETINNIAVSKTHLTHHYASQIYANYVIEKSDISVASNRFNSQNTSLGDLYKTQIDLANEESIYKEVQSHFSTNQPSTTELEIATDSSSTGTPPVCKIQKKSTSSAASSTPVDPCSYGWNIVAMTTEDKIEQILSSTSTPPTPTDLKDRYSALNKSTNKSP